MCVIFLLCVLESLRWMWIYAELSSLLASCSPGGAGGAASPPSACRDPSPSNEGTSDVSMAFLHRGTNAPTADDAGEGCEWGGRRSRALKASIGREINLSLTHWAAERWEEKKKKRCWMGWRMLIRLEWGEQGFEKRWVGFVWQALVRRKRGAFCPPSRGTGKNRISR